MDKEDKEKIAEILEESRRLKRNMKYLHIIAFCQTLTIIGMQYRIYQLENILVKINHSLSNLVEITGGNVDVIIELVNFLRRISDMISSI